MQHQVRHDGDEFKFASKSGCFKRPNKHIFLTLFSFGGIIMAKVVVTFNGQVQKEIAIDKARLNIGRRPSNDVVLDHLAISGRHAAIDTTNDGAFILDLGSTNGTSVNGQPVKKHLLQDNDVIELGKYKLTFKAEEALLLLPESEGVPLAENQTAKIKILNGANAGKEMSLNKPVTTLGSPGILVISIKREPQQYTISFIEGRVFPRINDQSIDARPRGLRHGDVIDLSGTKMEFLLGEK